MEPVYKNGKLTITFHPHILGSSDDIDIKPSLPSVKRNLHLIVEENTMEDLWHSNGLNNLGDKIRSIDEVIYMNLSRGDIERIYSAVKQVKEETEERIKKFAQELKNK